MSRKLEPSQRGICDRCKQPTALGYNCEGCTAIRRAKFIESKRLQDEREARALRAVLRGS